VKWTIRASSSRIAIRTLAFIAVLFFAYAAYHVWQLAAIGAAHKAKTLCSSVFVSKRAPNDVLREDLAGIVSLFRAQIDYQTQSVTASLMGARRQRAIFRGALGCTLLGDDADAKDMAAPGGQKQGGVSPAATSAIAPGLGDLPADPTTPELAAVLDLAFAEKHPDRPIRTRAVVIMRDGRIVAERYAPGITADTPLPGWSMTKSVTNALVGILVKQGRLAIAQPVAIAEWSAANDPRRRITLDQMLRMSSGLAFDERTGPVVSDVNRMLLRSRDTAAYALASPLQQEPGTHWHYSSGTSNIISRVVRNSVGGSVADYHAFPRTELFDRIGMTSAVLEVDAAGTFVGSSFMYATARDWARFGQLYLQNGIWKGKRILPASWVTYSRTPSPTAPQGRYGAHFWTNGRSEDPPAARPLPNLPADMFFAAGFDGQYIFVIPSRRLVIVRLGLSHGLTSPDLEPFISAVLTALSSDDTGKMNKKGNRGIES